MVSRTTMIALAACVVGGAGASAQEVRGAPPSQPAQDSRGTIAFVFENDLFSGEDKYYTNGWQLSWRSPSYDPPSWLRWLGDHSRFLLPRGGAMRWGAGLGQNIYTPSDTQLRVPDPSDRPYAGWLYAALGFAAYADRGPRLTEFGAVELQLGVVGPSALGEQVQNNVHDFINVDRALGWDYQLKDEPGVNLILTRQYRLTHPFNAADPRGYAIGFVPGYSVSLGNVQTYASAGLTMRIGRNLLSDFGPPRIRPAPAGSGFFQPDGRWGWYVLAGFEGRAVAQDIFLDGNTWRDGPSVTKRNFVGDGNFGFAIILPWTRLSYVHTFRSREFDEQKTPAEFGSLSASFRF
jgi:hypothetical protein